MLNRSVLTLQYKQPFIDWVNAVDPDDAGQQITLAEANEDTTAYMVEVEDAGEFAEWLELNGMLLFEDALCDWYVDPDLWPQDRSLGLFKSWCTLTLHTVVLDTGASPLIDDESGELEQER